MHIIHPFKVVLAQNVLTNIKTTENYLDGFEKTVKKRGGRNW